MSPLISLPLAYISWFVGLLVTIPLPRPLAALSVRIFASLYGIDPGLATRPLSSFRSIGDFFTRDLRPEVRPIEGAAVFPVDGTLRNVCLLSESGIIPQVKGKEYSLAKLLGDDPLADRLKNGQLWNMYLSPRDAHHIHAPVSGKIVKTIHLPGALWPVNDWALRTVTELFTVNERVITFIESEFGLLAVVMIGALNVGRISLAYHDLETNLRPWKSKQRASIEHLPGIQVSQGDKIGTFKMGSSVVIISEEHLVEPLSYHVPLKIKYGQSLG
jgi:phosphatidylserine decarboxylase